MALIHTRGLTLQRTHPSKSIWGPTLLPRRQLPLPKGRSRILQAPASREQNQTAETVCLDSALRAGVAGLLASGLLWLAPSPALADVQTVSPQLVTQMARPLPKQTVDKGKVWTIFIGGAVVLFAGTVVFENNPQFFPAITRANQAMKEATKRIEEQEKLQQKQQELLRLRQEQYDAEQRQLAAVQQGLKEARAKATKSSPAPEPVTPQPVAAAAAAVLSPPVPEVQAAQPAPAAHEPTPVPHVLGPVDAAEPRSEVPENSTVSSSAAAPYVVVEDKLPDMGPVAWSAAGEVAAAGDVAAVSTSGRNPAAGEPPVGVSAAAATAAVAVSPEEDAESLARLARLQGFVSETMTGSKGPLEALRSQRQ